MFNLELHRLKRFFQNHGIALIPAAAIFALTLWAAIYQWCC